MTRADLIHDLTSSGQLTQMFKLGLIDYKLMMYRDMYYDYLREVTLNRGKRNQAAFNVSEKYKVHITTVYRAIKFIRG